MLLRALFPREFVVNLIACFLTGWLRISGPVRHIFAQSLWGLFWPPPVSCTPFSPYSPFSRFLLATDIVTSIFVDYPPKKQHERSGFVTDNWGETPIPSSGQSTLSHFSYISLIHWPVEGWNSLIFQCPGGRCRLLSVRPKWYCLDPDAVFQVALAGFDHSCHGQKIDDDII